MRKYWAYPWFRQWCHCTVGWISMTSWKVSCDRCRTWLTLFNKPDSFKPLSIANLLNLNIYTIPLCSWSMTWCISWVHMRQIYGTLSQRKVRVLFVSCNQIQPNYFNPFPSSNKLRKIAITHIQSGIICIYFKINMLLNIC